MRRATRAWPALAFAILASAATAAAIPPGFADGTTERVLLTTDGAAPNGVLAAPVLARGGRYVVFVSNATNLVAGSSGTQVYRNDRETHLTELVSVNTSGKPTAFGASSPSVSADGRFVAFHSLSADLVAGDENATLDVFVRDMTFGSTVLASATAAGVPGERLSSDASLSADGRRVAFRSFATNLVAGANGRSHVYVKDLVSGAVVRVSVNDAGEPADDSSTQPALAGNGRVVAFISHAGNLTALPTGHTSQLFVRDLDAATTRIASVPTAVDPPPLIFWPASRPAVSFDGSTIAFESAAQLDTADLDFGTVDVYVRDRAAGTTRLASAGADLSIGTASGAPSISADGRYVAFQSADASVVPDDVNGQVDVFLFDRAAGTHTLVSLSSAEKQGDRGSASPSISGDGARVLFGSTATNFGGPASTNLQLYVRSWNTPPTVSLGEDVVTATGAQFSRTASVTDPDAGQSWTATVDWGDGTTDTLAVGADRTFTMRHAYAELGSYAARVVVEDSAGGTGEATLGVEVRFTVAWMAPTGKGPASSQAGRRIPFRFALSEAGDGAVRDEDLFVDVTDATGAVVAGPFVMGADPASGISFTAGTYQVVIPTAGLAAGTYEVRVHLGTSGDGYLALPLVLR